MEGRASPGPRHAGVDWSWEHHAVCVVGGDGAVLDRFVVKHQVAGLKELCWRLKALEVARVAIERPDGPAVQALLEAGFEVVVIASRQVKALRLRYGSSGNKDDRFDAYVLADVLRTDGHSLRALRPDSGATRALRALVCRPEGSHQAPAGPRQPAPGEPPAGLPRRDRAVRGPRQPDLPWPSSGGSPPGNGRPGSPSAACRPGFAPWATRDASLPRSFSPTCRRPRMDSPGRPAKAMAWSPSSSSTY